MNIFRRRAKGGPTIRTNGHAAAAAAERAERDLRETVARRKDVDRLTQQIRRELGARP